MTGKINTLACMPWTPVHRELGQTRTDLDFELIQSAVAAGVEERADLDWKGELPLKDIYPGQDAERVKKEEELAKDVAAMANSGGGAIVYGVEEAPGRKDVAGSLKPLGPWDADKVNKIRAVVHGLTYPPVTGLEMHHVHPDDDPDGGALVLIVPDSPDAPHLIHAKGSKRDEWRFQCPWRDGAETRWMAERQIADAYRRREVHRREEQEDFDALYDGFVQNVGAGQGTGPHWVIGVAQPVRRKVGARAPLVEDAGRLVRLAQHDAAVPGVTALCELGGATTRPGLRRVYRESGRRIGERTAESGTYAARIEVHSDGSLALGLTRDGLLAKGQCRPGVVPVNDLESVAREVAALIRRLVSDGTVRSDYMVRIGVAPKVGTFAVPDPTFLGHYQPIEADLDVRHHVPVDGLLPAQLGLEALDEAAAELITDVIQQVGVLRIVTAAELDRDRQLKT